MHMFAFLGTETSARLFFRRCHVKMDARTSTGFKGLPAEWRALLKTSQISKEEVVQNPQIVLDVLNFQMQGPPPVLPSQQTLKSAQEAASQFIKTDPNKVYKKIKKLGEGASGVVYSVIHRKTKEKFAVKITSALDLEAIKTEISMQQMSKHPNIVSYIETYLWDDNIWLIMECMDGGFVALRCHAMKTLCLLRGITIVSRVAVLAL